MPSLSRPISARRSRAVLAAALCAARCWRREGGDGDTLCPLSSAFVARLYRLLFPVVVRIVHYSHSRGDLTRPLTFGAEWRQRASAVYCSIFRAVKREVGGPPTTKGEFHEFVT